MAYAATTLPAVEPLGDEEVVARVLAGETVLFEVVMRRYNQRLYRAARSITRDDATAEEILQAAYVSAYEHLHQYRGMGSFAAWLTRIAVNEALGRLRLARRFEDLGEDDDMDQFAAAAPDPEQAAAASEAARLIESLVESLPIVGRTVFMLRDVEGMSTAETAQALSITEETVKVRLHRARALLRQGLSAYADRETGRAFAFHARRCDRVVAGVFARLSLR